MLEELSPNILRKKTKLSRLRKFIKSNKINWLIIDGLIFLTHQLRMLPLNDYSASKRSFWSTLKMEYYTSKNSNDLTNAEAQYQHDVSIKRNSQNLSEIIYD